MAGKAHWEEVYTNKSPQSVSWFQPSAETSLRLIRQAAPPNAEIIDVGGGASTLVDGLLDAGYRRLTVLDLAGSALAAAQARLGARAADVKWIEASILDAPLSRHAYDVWHDRAVFHFLTDPAERAAYVRQLLHALRPGGHVIVASFAEDGPEKCSGLPVMRYRPDQLHAEFGAPFTLLRHERETHLTPAGASQQFVYCYCRRSDG
jgi:SAM-dependent methyltransferase